MSSNNGESSSSKYVAFREAYGCLNELRSLVQQGVNFIALTATKKCILDILHMEDFVDVYEIPNKLNIMFSGSYIPKSTKIDDTFHWIIDKFVCTGSSMDRIIIYCQTIKQCTVVYSKMRAALEKHSLFVQSTNHQQVPLEMLHSCTPNANKDSIIKSFQNPQGAVRFLVCTIAFGMGIDCKGVYTSIHFGPPKNVESYIQESGRIGRDGKPSRSFIIYQGILLEHVERDIKEYLKTTECRRKKLMNDFGVLPSNVQLPQPAHMCCDNCALKCLCGMTTCKTYAIYPGQPHSESETNVPAPRASREVTTDHYYMLEKELLKYRKKLLKWMLWQKQLKGKCIYMFLHRC